MNGNRELWYEMYEVNSSRKSRVARNWTLKWNGVGWNIAAPTSSSADKMLMFLTQLFGLSVCFLFSSLTHILVAIVTVFVCYSVVDVVSSVNMIYIKSQLIYE